MFNAEGGFDMNALLQQAQALQEQLKSAQDDLAHRQVTGSAGGDLVTVTMTGAQEITKVTIKPEACDPADVETLEDLILAACRDAAHQAQALAQAAMPQIPGLGF
ncbi:MAG: YbaB/EbfC family nucleoid-associated protein [Propionibacterium sp.]|nr:YbaB/EbfC family nucleoid-associated protein [Propionibacterium sp.]